MAKERLTVFKPVSPKTAPKANLNNMNYLLYLLQRMEDSLFIGLGGKMKAAGKEGMFTTWMYDESDTIQAAGRAYTERLVAESFLDAIQSADPGIQPILEQLYKLYILDIVESNLGKFLTAGLIDMETAKGVNAAAARLCKEIAPHSLALVDAFGIPDGMLSAPIAHDWVQFNTYNNQGEVRK